MRSVRWDGSPQNWRKGSSLTLLKRIWNNILPPLISMTQSCRICSSANKLKPTLWKVLIYFEYLFFIAQLEKTGVSFLLDICHSDLLSPLKLQTWFCKFAGSPTTTRMPMEKSHSVKAASQCYMIHAAIGRSVCCYRVLSFVSGILPSYFWQAGYVVSAVMQLKMRRFCMNFYRFRNIEPCCFLCPQEKSIMKSTDHTTQMVNFPFYLGK